MLIEKYKSVILDMLNLIVACPTAMYIVQTGKWRKPTGVLVDQVGHLLVVDQVKHVINSLELLTRHAGQR